MSSTRNLNTPGNYCLEQRQFKEFEQYTLYPNSQYGAAADTRLPGNGVNPGQIPWNQLSNNSVQIESFLFGISSTNLVNPSLSNNKIVPDLKPLKSADFFEKSPLLMPEPLAVEKRQRPFPCP